MHEDAETLLRRRLIKACIRAHKRFERRDDNVRAQAGDRETLISLASEAFATWKRLAWAWKDVR